MYAHMHTRRKAGSFPGFVAWTLLGTKQGNEAETLHSTAPYQYQYVQTHTAIKLMHHTVRGHIGCSRLGVRLREGNPGERKHCRVTSAYAHAHSHTHKSTHESAALSITHHLRTHMQTCMHCMHTQRRACSLLLLMLAHQALIE